MIALRACRFTPSESAARNAATSSGGGCFGGSSTSVVISSAAPASSGSSASARPAACIASAGVGIGYAAMPTLILDAVPAHEAAAAVGLNALMRSVGTTLAAAAMGTILTSNTVPFGDVQVPSAGAFQACFAVGAAAALLGALITVLVPRREPAAGESQDAAVPVAASR